MTKIDKHIEIVRSSTPGLSSMGIRSCMAIQKVLEAHFTKVGVTTVSVASDLDILAHTRPDFVFLGAKGVPVEPGKNDKVWLAEYFERIGIPYTGSPSKAIELDFHKPAAKKAVYNAGFATARYFTASVGEYSDEKDFPFTYPLFIKPPDAGGGRGIGDDSVVRNFGEYTYKVDHISRNFHSEALVEEYLPGREFSVAVLESTTPGELITMPLELITNENDRGDRVIGHKVKQADSEQVYAVEDIALRHSLSQLAEGAFRALGARGYGRIDMRLDEHGRPHFLEANLIPSLIEGYGNFPKACFMNHSLSHEDMILEIVRLGMVQERSLLPELTPKVII